MAVSRAQEAAQKTKAQPVLNGQQEKKKKKKKKKKQKKNKKKKKTNIHIVHHEYDDSRVQSGLALLTSGGSGGGGGGSVSSNSSGISSVEGEAGVDAPVQDATSPSPHSAPQEALTLLQGELVPHTNFTHTFLKSILTSIDSKDPVVANAWLETLLDVIDLLPKEVIKDEILSLAVSKGQSQQVSARLAACKLIGKIATKFEPFLLKTEVVGVVQSLCQDVCGEVRGSMCSQLAAVARGLGLDATKTHILPELVDLCSDEETNVRLAGINTVVLMIPLLDDETRVGTLVPLVRKVCERALRVEDASLPVAAHLLGRICHGLHDELNEEQKTWFLNFYCTLAKLGLPDSKKTELPMPDLVAEVRSGEYEAECRQQCAYNLPCMVAFAGGSTNYRSSLHTTVSSLINDPSQQVRTTVAAAFHQLCILVGAEVGMLKEGLLQLLRSENLDILSALMPNLPHIITTMHRHNAVTPQTSREDLVELVGAIKQGEETVSITSVWRVHAEALTQAAALAPCLPADLIFTQLVPLMFVRMQTARPIPCRLAAARTLLVYLRHMSTQEQRDHISNTIVSEFCEGTSCHKRMLFLNIATMVLEMFSKSFFKTYFYRPLLSLHSDRVPNIRLKLVTMLPQMKATLSLPDDKTRLQELETVVGSLLMSEGDRDVSAAISVTISQLDKIEVCESQRGSPEGESGGQETEDEWKERQERRAVGDSKSLDVKSPDGSRTESTSLGERHTTSRSSNRRSSGLGRLPAYLERRRSNSHAPKQPPDECTILRSLLSFDRKYLKKNCRISTWPYRGAGYQASTTNTSNSTTNKTEWSLDDDDDDDEELDISDICDEVLLSPEEPSIDWEEQLSPQSPRITLDPPSSSSSLSRSPQPRDRLVETRDRQHPDAKDILSTSKENLSTSRDRLLEARDRLSESRGRHSRRPPALQTDDNEDGDRLSAREVFWLRTSRPRWRRKVASADTSPEEPRRSKFGRGLSIDGRGSHSDTEDPDILYDGRRHSRKETKELVSVIHSTASPPSPHGMYTWPPQHTRHRHHSASETDEFEDQQEQSHSQSGQRFESQFDSIDRHHSPTPHYDTPSVHSSRRYDLSPRREDSTSYESHSDYEKSRHQNKNKLYVGSANSYYGSSSSKQGSRSPKYSSSLRSADPSSLQSPLHIQYVENIDEDNSGTGARQYGLSPPPLRDNKPHRFIHPRDTDDTYIYHGITPTLAPTHLSAVYSPHSIPTHFSYDHPEEYLSSLAFTEPYSPDPYHTEMLAAAELFPREPYPQYRYEGDRSRGSREHEPRLIEQQTPHSYFLLDTAELAPWSSPPAYPIGPLGASWLQHGLHPLARIPSCLIPTPYSRPRPHAPLASPPWRLTHHASFPSMSALDPTTDEFLVDAGIRIDESVIKSRLPTPQSSHSNMSRWRGPSRSYGSHSSVSSEGTGIDVKNRGSNYSSSRLRQPSSLGSSRIPAPGSISSSHIQDDQERDGRGGGRRDSSGSTGSNGSNVITRLRPPARSNRPVSTVASSTSRVPLPSRSKSLSHENLRTSPSRLALPTSPSESPTSSRATSPRTSPQEADERPRTLAVSGSRLRQPQVRTPRGRGSRPTSCSSSPGGSRCSSPGMEVPVSGFGRGSRSSSRAGSASSSPASSRCSSPGPDDMRSLSRSSQHRTSSSRTGSGVSRANHRSSSTTPDQHVTTPPSPVPSSRNHRQGSSIPKPSSGSRGRTSGSKLPLPTSARN
ncbi:serine/arginine repetitive matrix protein 2-like [Macrobrachium nipponense]|uniref:serine/arginine repetitive matrix protein 2-like n=1 Tax=Macrobrachium nipponense TaxID=159736 RepID=UPI0030C80724